MTAVDVGKRFLWRSGGPRARTLKQMALRGFRSAPMQEHWAVRGVSLDVKAGEAVGVLGHNGSGKSTLLRMLGGVMQPDEGAITRVGKVRGLLELTTGIHGDLSGRENIYINGVIAGLTRREITARIDEIIAFSELGEAIDTPVRTYSSGMKLRLGFSVAAHADPDVLLIDEVLSVGDLAFQKKCLDRIHAIRDGGCAIVLITHELDQIEHICERAIWMSQGRCIAQGAPGMLVGEYRVAMDVETSLRAPKDVEALVLPSGVRLVMGENRFGSLDAEIVDVRILNAQGRPVREIAPGAGLSVELDIRAHKPIHGARACLSIGRGELDDVLDLNSERDGFKVGDLNGDARVRIDIERLDLAPGPFEMSVGLYEAEWRYSYDYHWRAHPLVVEGDKPDRGWLGPPRTWRRL
ncbi:ABC transporter ATP-binding protein [Phenylobacterium sp. LjRoot225]|uniref:ABC transporter ATP-binding protein n=1 Tax=Phenylobacterium sp. LjRoot225 TaxID=3342285 RepID=UPI003ECDE8DD